MDNGKKFEKMIEEPNTIVCRRCRHNMKYNGSGIYECIECGWKYLSNFGKVKRYLDENGPCTAVKLSKETGVSQKVINQLIEEGRIEAVNIRK